METSLSQITLLPILNFILLMVPIHLLIGAVEGVATASVLTLIQKTRPVILDYYPSDEQEKYSFKSSKWVVAALAAFILLGSTIFYRYASGNPDGLEWSIAGVANDHELAQIELAHRESVHEDAVRVQTATAFMPEYDNHLAGLVGCGAVLIVVCSGFALISNKRKKLISN
jgi:cobalt/nickel transport system permease protein